MLTVCLFILAQMTEHVDGPNKAQGVLPPNVDDLYTRITNAEDGNQVTVHFTKHDNSLVVAARINGKGPFYFVVDTGAASTVISDKVAKAATLVPTGKKAKVVGVSGRPMYAWVGRARDVSIGGAKAKSLEVMVRDIGHLNKQGLAGLLGQDFLGRFSVAIDNREGKMTLSLPDQPADRSPNPTETLMRDILDQHDHLARTIGGFDRDTAQWLRRYQNPERGKIPEALQAWTRQLSTDSDQLARVHDTLHRAATVHLDGDRKNNLQRFLYCYPAYQAYEGALAQLAKVLAENWATDNAAEVGEWAGMVSRARKSLSGCDR